jgi:hypothetical protein
MARTITPRLEVLPPAQRIVWGELSRVPADFALYGGTAVALRLGHRQSVDFDFFAPLAVDPDNLIVNLELLRSAEIIQKEDNTLTVIVERGAPVQISFFGVPRLGQVLEPDLSADTGVRIASLLDLAGTKLAVVQKRAEARDYVDVDAILQTGSLDLSAALSAACVIYGPQFNPQISLKALSFFDDGNLAQLDRSVRNRLAAAVRAVDLDLLPELVPYRRPHGEA